MAFIIFLIACFLVYKGGKEVGRKEGYKDGFSDGVMSGWTDNK